MKSVKESKEMGKATSTGAADMVTKITALNKKIDGLMNQRTKVEAQRELLEKNLKQGMAEYKKNYNVDLASPEGFSAIKENITKEVASVRKAVEKEYALASEVVACIENGDYAGANSLLGVKTEEGSAEATDTEPASEESASTPNRQTKKSSAKKQEPLTGIADIADNSEEDFDVEGGFNFDGDFGVEADEEEGATEATGAVEEESSSDDDSYETFFFEEEEEGVADFDDDDFGFGDMLNNGKF